MEFLFSPAGELGVTRTTFRAERVARLVLRCNPIRRDPATANGRTRGSFGGLVPRQRHRRLVIPIYV